MIPLLTDSLSMPLLVTTAEGKPLGRNNAFRQAKGTVTSHPCSYLSRHDLFTLSHMPPHACHVFTLLPSRGGATVVVLHRGTHLLWLFSSVLREQCYFPVSTLELLAHQHLHLLLPPILDGTLRSAKDVAERLAEHFFQGKCLSLKGFTSIASLALRLLFSEDCLTEASDDALFLLDITAAFAALGALMPLLADTQIEKETPPPVSLQIKDDSVFFCFREEALPVTKLRLPTAVEAVAPYSFHDTEAKIALLLAFLCETVLPQH